MEMSESNDWNRTFEQVLIGVFRVGSRRLSLAFKVPLCPVPAWAQSCSPSVEGLGVGGRWSGSCLPTGAHLRLFLWQQRHLVVTSGLRPSFPASRCSLPRKRKHFRLQRGFQTHRYFLWSRTWGLFTSVVSYVVPSPKNITSGDCTA